MTVEHAPRLALRRLSENVVARYALAAIAVIVAFALRKLLEPNTGTGAPFVLFFGAVLIASLVAGTGPGILATLLSIALGAYSFVVRAGYEFLQVVFQSSLFAIDCMIVVYLSSVVTRARRIAERSEARMRDILELAPDAFYLADLAGRIVEVNQAGSRMLGYDHDELVGKSILDVIPAADAPRLLATRAALLTPGQIHRGEWTLKRKDGTSVAVEVSSNILADGRWQAFMRDITQRKRIEDERQVYVSLVENAPDFIGIADPAGTPIYVNPAGRRMVGLPVDYPVENTRIPDYYPPERMLATDEVVRTLNERNRWSGETRFRNWQTAEVIPVSAEHFVIRDATGRRVLGIGTITRDISEARRIAREREELLSREQLARRQAEAANEQLRESEERFRLTIEGAPIGMALVALDGRFVRVNNAYCEIVGYTADEMTRLRFGDITHPDEVDEDVEASHRLARGEVPRLQLDKRYVRKDGVVIDIRLSASVLRDRDGAARYFITQVEDITERKRADRQLRFSEARFSGMISIAADAIISIDEDQRITLFNDGAERIFGYARSEVLGTPLDVLIPERFRAGHRTHVARFATGPVGARQVGERLATITGRRKSGEEFPAEAAISKLELDGNPVYTVVLRDVTERRRVDKEQRLLADAGAVLASSLDYEQTLVTVGQLVVRELADWCIVDLLEEPGRPRRVKIVCADPSQASLAAELETLSIDRQRPYLLRPLYETRRPYLRDRVTPADLMAASQSPEHLRLLRAVDPRSVMGLPLLARGELIGVLVLVSTTPAHVYTPDDLRFAAALADRAALAIENGRLYLAALQATRLREQVLGVVAHDLRNPLGAISIQADALRRRDPERRNQRPREVILRAANRMNRLIQDLLDVSLVEAGQLGLALARVSPAQLLADTVEEQRSLAASASLEVHLDVACELPEIWADPHRLIQVLENLIGNAIKFVPADGRIAVGAAPRDDDVMFWVADTGPGISPAEMSRIFDPFWQAKKGDRRGVGLGLPITRGIVEAHGGRIWVESTPGRGSIFFFTIPRLARRDAQRSAPASG
jgi:PAS domain S-box-containing protein